MACFSRTIGKNILLFRHEAEDRKVVKSPWLHTRHKAAETACSGLLACASYDWQIFLAEGYSNFPVLDTCTVM